MCKEFNLGDKVWFISDNVLIAIECTIEEIDDWARKQSPTGYLFYELSEPVGHGVLADNLFHTREEALSELKDRYKYCCENKEDFSYEQFIPVSLFSYRSNTIDFIVGTDYEADEDEKERIKMDWMEELPQKSYITEWFNVRYIAGQFACEEFLK